jgi:hypothetical protein
MKNKRRTNKTEILICLLDFYLKVGEIGDILDQMWR